MSAPNKLIRCKINGNGHKVACKNQFPILICAIKSSSLNDVPFEFMFFALWPLYQNKTAFIALYRNNICVHIQYFMVKQALQLNWNWIRVVWMLLKLSFWHKFVRCERFQFVSMLLANVQTWATNWWQIDRYPIRKKCLWFLGDAIQRS